MVVRWNRERVLPFGQPGKREAEGRRQHLTRGKTRGISEERFQNGKPTEDSCCPSGKKPSGHRTWIVKQPPRQNRTDRRQPDRVGCAPVVQDRGPSQEGPNASCISLQPCVTEQLRRSPALSALTTPHRRPGQGLGQAMSIGGSGRGGTRIHPRAYGRLKKSCLLLQGGCT